MLIGKLRTFFALSAAAGMLAVIRWRWLPKDKIFKARIAGFDVQLRARTSDLTIAIECLTSEYEAVATLFPCDFDGVIVDAGGHIGCAALRLASLFPKARIVCIEPASDNLRILSENTRSMPRIEVRRAALVANSTGRITLSDRGRDGSGYTVVADSQDTPQMHRLEEVETIQITDIFEEFGHEIGFIKLDIEGAERDILALSSFRNQDIPAVFIELHEHINPGCTEAFNAFAANRWTLRLGAEKYLSLARTPGSERGSSRTADVTR